MSHAHHLPNLTPDQTHVQLAVNNPDMTEKVATQPVLPRRYRGTPFNELRANGYFEPETAMQAFRKTMTTHYSHGFPASPANEWLGLGGRLMLHSMGEFACDQASRQGKRVGRWYDITSETGAVRLQIDCITTSLIEVDGGFCGLISGFALEVVLAKGKEHTQEWSHGSQGESPAVRNVPVPF